MNDGKKIDRTGLLLTSWLHSIHPFFFRVLAFVLEPVCKMLSNQRELIYNLIVFFSWKTTEKERTLNYFWNV